MEKRIVKIKKNQNGSINSCIVKLANKGTQVESKQTIIDNIKSGEDIYYSEVNGERGALVKVIKGSYLRSDKDETTADNLGNLPNFV